MKQQMAATEHRERETERERYIYIDIRAYVFMYIHTSNTLNLMSSFPVKASGSSRCGDVGVPVRLQCATSLTQHIKP